MTDGGIDDLYRAIILDHYQRPRNHGRLDAPSVAARGSNPLCGDEVEVALRITGERITDVAFQGRGCSISQASASLMTESVKGKTLTEAIGLLGQFRLLITEPDGPEAPPDGLGDLGALHGVRRYPVRVRCALLAWNVLKEGLDRYTGGEERRGPGDRRRALGPGDAV
ncbi:MAG TPA: SUF system NifU family Fe-S cluster assembly protein [Chloroflexota bacterium]|nr:SUF system NifU family Fe-S cluster assembly protein [Chloroflexota bacterium]